MVEGIIGSTTTLVSTTNYGDKRMKNSTKDEALQQL